MPTCLLNTNLNVFHLLPRERLSSPRPARVTISKVIPQATATAYRQARSYLKIRYKRRYIYWTALTLFQTFVALTAVPSKYFPFFILSSPRTCVPISSNILQPAAYAKVRPACTRTFASCTAIYYINCDIFSKLCRFRCSTSQVLFPFFIFLPRPTKVFRIFVSLRVIIRSSKRYSVIDNWYR